jgi:hypothetical protein
MFVILLAFGIRSAGRRDCVLSDSDEQCMKLIRKLAHYEQSRHDLVLWAVGNALEWRGRDDGLFGVEGGRVGDTSHD